MSPTVIVPVYNAPADLAICLDSLLRTLDSSAQVLIVDDASPDPRVAPVIRRFSRQAQFAVVTHWRSENMGFVGNVNRAFRDSAPADVVILNADTITTPQWLDRISACAASDATIATITPWSNNAEICSYPHFCASGDVPDDLDEIAAAARDLVTTYPELPTGVGFCMFIRRAALDAIGDFDAATFGRGYGEENDFCRRAAAHGWRNVLCDDAFVAHRGGASFGPTGLKPGGENLLRLCARYPDYNARVANFIMRDPLAELRQRLAERHRARRAVPLQRPLFE
ncbi:MAG: glycosyltransferase family 2 protein [Pseudomarimonas sp.]